MARGDEDHLAKDSAGSSVSNRPASSAFGWQGGADPAAGGAEHVLPGLHGEERLPWLYSAEDDRDQTGLDAGRVWAFVLSGFALLAVMVGGVWWTAHRRDNPDQVADGSVIAAPPGPIKVAPQDPGGKLFDGTGDSSFTVSQGHAPGATLAVGADQADGGPAMGSIQPIGDSDTTPATVAGSGNASGGIGVQVGAFSSQVAAEAAWGHLVTAYDALSGASHRIVASKADIGTVYGLQAVAGNAAAANALCDKLKTAGLNCQVKD